MIDALALFALAAGIYAGGYLGPLAFDLWHWCFR